MKLSKSISVLVGAILIAFPVVFFFQNCARPSFTENNGQVATSGISGAVICTNSAMDSADCVPANADKSCSFIVSPLRGSEAPSYFITIQNHETTKESYYDTDINGGGPGGMCRSNTLSCEGGKLYFGSVLLNRDEVFSGCLEIQL